MELHNYFCALDKTYVLCCEEWIEAVLDGDKGQLRVLATILVKILKIRTKEVAWGREETEIKGNRTDSKCYYIRYVILMKTFCVRVRIDDDTNCDMVIKENYQYPERR